MFIIIHATAYGHYLIQYPPNHNWKPNGWVWSLERSDAKQFPTKDQALEAMKAADKEMVDFGGCKGYVRELK